MVRRKSNPFAERQRRLLDASRLDSFAGQGFRRFRRFCALDASLAFHGRHDMSDTLAGLRRLDVVGGRNVLDGVGRQLAVVVDHVGRGEDRRLGAVGDRLPLSAVRILDGA